MATQRKIVELFAGSLSLSVEDQGTGRPFLILHGGAGPGSVMGLAGALAANGRAIVPTHPGFAGQPRPEWFKRIDDLVLAYLDLLERLDASDAIIVGSSLGGWIAAEMALRRSPRIAGIVLLNAVGIEVGATDKPIVDPMKLAPSERAALAFHDPARFAIAPAGPEAAAAMEANQRTLRVYAGAPFMHDPTLQPRLAQLAVPALVAWGESDRIVEIAYGRRFAEAMPGARFERIAQAGHFPHIERLDEVASLVGGFAASLARAAA